MAKKFLTIEYNGVEKTMEDWGFASASLTLVSQSADRFSAKAVVKRAATTVPAIPFDGWIIVRDLREKNISTGALENGQIVFQGSRKLLPKKVEARGDVLSYSFTNPWSDLEEITFQQARKVWLGGDPNDPANFDTDYTTEIVLFQKLDPITATKPQNIGEQITEILTYAIAQGARLKIGTIEPTENVNTYQVLTTFCSSAINLSLRSRPDATAFFDYSTTPPTIHVLKRASRPPKTSVWMDRETHQTSEITGREDLQVPCVSLKFKRTNSINGRSFTEPMNAPPNWQLYPPGATGRERAALIETIDLQGWSKMRVNGTLVAEPLTANGTDDQRKAFWKRQCPQLKSPRSDIQTIGAATVKDEADALVDLGQYPNELREGLIAPWMTIGTNPPTAVKFKRCTVEAEITYNELDENNQPTRKFTKHSFSAPVVLTDAISGDYSTDATAIDGEPIPAGLAQSIFEALALREYEGTHTVVGQYADYSIGMGNTLNISGGDPDWAAMKASIRSIRYDYGEAYTSTVTEIGPAPHLSAGDRTQLFLFNKQRRIYFNPATFGTAEAGTGGSVTMAKQAPRENTNKGLSQLSFQAVATPVPLNTDLLQSVHLDAENHKVQIAVVDKATGQPDESKGGFWFKVIDCHGSDNKMHKVYAHEEPVYDANCNVRYRIVLASDPYVV